MTTSNPEKKIKSPLNYHQWFQSIVSGNIEVFQAGLVEETNSKGFKNSLWIHKKNKNGEYPLFKVIQRKKPNWLNLLISHGVNIHTEDEQGESALMLAAFNRQLKMVKMLIKAGSLINHQNKNGVTALMRAISANHEPIAFELINAGADIKIKDRYGETALTLAARKNINLVNKLISNGPLNDQNQEGVTPLMFSILYGKKDCAEALVLKGACVNMKDIHDNTALMYAIKKTDTFFVKLLLKAGADVHAINKAKESALSMIVSSDRNEVLQLILEQIDLKDNIIDNLIELAQVKEKENCFNLLKNKKEHQVFKKILTKNHTDLENKDDNPCKGNRL